jgi:hypothetical protein
VIIWVNYSVRVPRSVANLLFSFVERLTVMNSRAWPVFLPHVYGARAATGPSFFARS